MTEDARIVQVIRNIFEVRTVTFEPGRFRRRIRLVSGLLRDVPKGKLTAGTLKDLQEEVIATIKESPFLR